MRRLALSAMAGLMLTACAGATPGDSPQPGASPAAAVLALPSPSATYDATGDPIVRVVEAVTPAVVTVRSRTRSANPFFGPPTEGEAVGTGFVVRSDGYILTNEHVVADATDITVVLSDGRSLAARVVATDPDRDLAVLKVVAGDLPVIALGDSSTVAAGQPVVAIGYALNLSGGPTVTSGIVSSVQRTIDVQDSNGGPGSTVRTYRDVIQTDAAVNPGNSGGPLLTLDGTVVGVVSAGGGSAENIGFAIAINAAKPLIATAVAT
jgi:serine protease Do